MNKGQSRPSLGVILGSWIAAALGIVLLVAAGAALMADLGSLRSCNVNSSGLMIRNCGKQSLNSGDLLLIGIFVACLAAALSLVVHAVRKTRRPR